MKRFNVTVICTGVYSSAIDVPDGLSEEAAIQYAKDHLYEIPATEITWLGDVEIDEENCDFDGALPEGEIK